MSCPSSHVKLVVGSNEYTVFNFPYLTAFELILSMASRADILRAEPKTRKHDKSSCQKLTMIPESRAQCSITGHNNNYIYIYYMDNLQGRVKTEKASVCHQGTYELPPNPVEFWETVSFASDGPVCSTGQHSTAVNVLLSSCV